MTDFETARTKMVDSQLRTEDVTDRRVLAAMGDIAREAFVPARLRDLAYIDQDLAIREAEDDRPARYLTEAAPFARLLQLADLKSGDLVLDVGCGSGYSTVVLARLAESVVALESDEDLASEASEALTELEVDNAAVVTGPLTEGHAAEGPYDVILLNGSVDEVPQALLDQVKDGGRLVAVVGRGRAGSATLFARSGDEISSRVDFDADVPPLPGFEKPAAFVF